MRVTCYLVGVKHIMRKKCPDDSDHFLFIFIKLADKGNRHKILDKFDFSAVRIIGLIVTRP